MVKILNKTKVISSQYADEANQALEALKSRSDLGFLKLAERDEIWTSSLKRAEEIRSEFEHLVVVGIGGSSLGPKTLTNAVKVDASKTVSYIDNVDGLEVSRFLQSIDNVEKVHWLFISKSGGTRETLTLLDFISQWLDAKDLKVENVSTVITENKSSALYDWAEKESIPTLELPLDVGGRFSVFTPVGLLPAAFAGHDINSYREGIRWALNSDSLVTDLVVQSMQSWEREEWITAIWVYSSVFADFGRWTQQLWAESLGKKIKRDGSQAPQASMPLPLVGSTDQHSVLQQLSEGSEKKFIWFVRVLEGETCGEVLHKGSFLGKTQMGDKPLGALLAAFAASTQKALQQDGVESLSLQIEKADEKSVASLMMVMMLIVGTLGEVLDINAFDQPGVELGKRLVKDFL